MLQCLNKATKLEPNSPDLHVAAAKYLHYCELFFFILLRFMKLIFFHISVHNRIQMHRLTFFNFSHKSECPFINGWNELHSFFTFFTADEKAQLEGTVKELAAELTGILFPNTKSASEFNTAFKSANINSFPHRLAGIHNYFSTFSSALFAHLFAYFCFCVFYQSF